MKSSVFFYSLTSSLSAITLGIALLLGLQACTPATASDALPRRLAVIPLQEYRERIVSPAEIAVAPNGYVYIADRNGSIEILQGTDWVASVPWPNHRGVERWATQIVAHPRNGYVYLTDGGHDTVHVLHRTELVTSLHIGGMYAQNLTIDEASGYVYAVGFKKTIQPEKTPVNRLGIIDGTEVISRSTMHHVHTTSIAYNPIDKRVYLGQGNTPSEETLDLVLAFEQEERVAEPILGRSEYGYVTNIAVNEKTGEMYMIRNNRGILYWDGAAYTSFLVPPREPDKAYVLEDIAIDTQSGLAYAASSDVPPSHVFVLQRNQVIAELPLPGSFNRSVTVDEKHDYVYVTHYRSGGLSVIRGTDVITTLSTGGSGPWEAAFDARTHLLYVTNADSGSVTVFGFDEPPAAPSALLRRFLPWVSR